jgi:hypothetical protein
MSSDEIQPPRRLRWFILVESKVYGPFDKAAIAQMAERNQMLGDDQVHVEGGSSWIVAKRDVQLASLFESNPTPPSRRKRRSTDRWFATASTVAILAVVFWVAWPYYAVVSLMAAAREGDVATLEHRVDWNSVRQGLRGDLNALILKSMADKGASDDAMAKGFAALLGPAVINNMVDGYVTPQGIAAMVKNEKPQAASDALPAIKSADRIRQIDWDKVTYAFFKGGPFSFRVDVLPDKETDRPIGLEFAWSGDWRLARIQLPADLLDASSKSVSSGPNRSTPPSKTQQSKIAEPSPVELTLFSKKFREANFRATPVIQTAIEFELSIVNKTQQQIRAFDGILTFTDILDNELLSSKLAINDPLNAGSSVRWSGEIEYNQFMDSHKRLRSADLQNIKIKFVPRKLLYADGSSREFN